MPDALGITGDVAAAGTALAGLILVFMGGVAARFDGYEKQGQAAVRAKYQLRIWFAFVGFVLAILAAFSALIAKWYSINCAAFTAALLLFVSFAWAVATAVRAAMDIK